MDQGDSKMATTSVATAQQKSVTNQILHGDCIDVMRQMPANSVDFILTDPPYLVNYRERTGRTIQNDADESWLKPTMAEAFRVLKQDRVAIMFYGWTKIDAFFEAWRIAGFQPVGHIVFRKSYSSKSRFLRYQHEQAFLLAKGRPPLPKRPLGDVMEMPCSGNKLHPTQKPVPALAQLIRSFSLPGESVLDPFAGSGSTCAAALLTGRKYIGVEMDDVYFQHASERLQRVHQRVAQSDLLVRASHASVMLLAYSPRLKAHILLPSSCSSLDPRRAREFSANHSGNAMLCACAAQCFHEPLPIVRVPNRPPFCVSGLLLQME
jgi:DNA modification methylase